MKKAILLGLVTVATAISLASCTTTSNDPRYTKLTEGEYQIAGHPWKSAKDCKRVKPVGKFDPKCDVPVLGYRNAADPTPGGLGAAGGIGGLGVSGL